MINKKETWEHFGFSEEVFEANKTSFCDIFTLEDFNNEPSKMESYILQNGGYEAYVLKP